MCLRKMLREVKIINELMVLRDGFIFTRKNQVPMKFLTLEVKLKMHRLNLFCKQVICICIEMQFEARFAARWYLVLSVQACVI